MKNCELKPAPIQNLANKSQQIHDVKQWRFRAGFRAGFRTDSNREAIELGPPAGGPILRFSRLESGRNPARQEGRFRCLPDSIPAEIRPGSPISGPEALMRNVQGSR